MTRPERLIEAKSSMFAYGISVALLVALTLFIAFPAALLPGMADLNSLGHVLGFALLVLPAAALHPRSLVVLVPVFLLFGAAVELIQPFVGREGDWTDMAANAGGLAGGTAVGLAFRRAILRLLA